MNIEQILSPGMLLYIFIGVIALDIVFMETADFKEISTGQIISIIAFLPSVVIISVVLVALLLIAVMVRFMFKNPLLKYKPFKRSK